MKANPPGPPATEKPISKILLKLAIAEGLFQRWNPDSGPLKNQFDGIQVVYLLNADAVMEVLEKEKIIS